MLGSHWAFWKGYAAAFAALTLFYAAPFLVGGATASQAIRNAVAALLPNALLGVVGVSVPRRIPWRRNRPFGFLTAHGLVIAALALLATCGWMVLAALDSWVVGKGFAMPANRVLVLFQILISALVQLAVMGVGHARYGAEKYARAEALRARAELALLRSQLNPHFVLSTLHALMGLVRREPAKAEAALERLGELLRFGLHVHHANLDQVSFREEWAFVGSYLALEQLRLGDRLRLTLSAGEDVMDVPVPPFALQPLVENAIVHAISPRREGGRLDLSVSRVNGRLLLDVEDDGPGTSESAVAASPRLGVRLLRERLAALYGGDARLVFERAAEGGLHVRLDLPAGGAREAA
jgi:signal transduction histidine kinase